MIRVGRKLRPILIGALAYIKDEEINFKGVVSQQQWLQSMESIRKPLGQNLSRELQSKQYHTSLPGAPDGEYVVIQFASSFSNKKSAIETVTPMLDTDGKWRVSGYYIK